MRAFFKWTGIVIVSFFVLMVAIGVMLPDQADERTTGVASARQLEKFTAGDLARAYEANSVAGDQLFKGKRFEVTGKVASIATDFMGDP